MMPADVDQVGNVNGSPHLVVPLPIYARSPECGSASGHAMASIRCSLEKMQPLIYKIVHSFVSDRSFCPLFFFGEMMRRKLNESVVSRALQTYIQFERSFVKFCIILLHISAYVMKYSLTRSEVYLVQHLPHRKRVNEFHKNHNNVR